VCSVLGTKTSSPGSIFFLGSSCLVSRFCSERAFHPSQGFFHTLLRVYSKLPTMLPRREASNEESSTDTSSLMKYLALALQELIRLQQRRPPATMQLDTHFQLPKVVGQMNGETMDSWICSLSTYFKTSRKMEEATKLQIASLQLEGITQTWWDTHFNSVELSVSRSGSLDSLGNHCENLTHRSFFLHLLGLLHFTVTNFPDSISGFGVSSFLMSRVHCPLDSLITDELSARP
jgi:hypothetical protein